MSNLDKSLKEWVSLGFISANQAKSIHDHESAKPESSWILSGLLILGAVIIGIGIISLIAANWNQIPDFVKLATDFTVLVLLAFATLNSWESKKAIQFEVLLLFFLLLCLASIGLISQIYNTGGEFYEALMLWSLITFAAATAAKQMFVPFIWTGAFLTGLVFTALESLTMQTIFHKNQLAIFMAVPLLCAGFTIVSKGFAGEVGPTRAFRSWTLIGGIFALAVAEFPEFSPAKYYEGINAFIPGYLLGIFAAFGIWQSLEYRNLQKTLLLATLGIFLVPFHLPLLNIKTSIGYAALTIIVLGLMSIFLASLKERRLFQWFLSLLGMRFLILYFQALGGLATTGIGLIISGGVVIAMAIAWNKYRTTLAVWAERWAQ